MKNFASDFIRLISSSVSFSWSVETPMGLAFSKIDALAGCIDRGR